MSQHDDDREIKGINLHKLTGPGAALSMRSACTPHFLSLRCGVQQIPVGTSQEQTPRPVGPVTPAGQPARRLRTVRTESLAQILAHGKFTNVLLIH